MTRATTPGRRRGPAIPAIGDITLAHLQARTTEEGDCMLWDGYTDRIGSPQWRVGGKCWPARRLLWELTRGPVPAKHQVSAHCGIAGCVHPDHLVCRTRSRIQRGARRSPATAIRIALTHRAKATARLTPAVVAAIRASDEPGRVLEQRYGLSAGRASRVRSGAVWRDYSNPFAGLLKP